MKKLFALLLCVALLTGCAAAPSETSSSREASSAPETSSSSEASSSSEPSSPSSRPVIVVPSQRSESSSGESMSEAESESSEESAPSESASESEPPEASRVETSSASSESETSSSAPESGSDAPGFTPPSDTTSSPRDTVADETEIFALINGLRASLGLGQLELHYNLRAAARIRAEEFAVYDLQSHIRPDGRSWETVLQKDIPVAFRIAAENLAGVRTNVAGYAGMTPKEYFDGWCNSPDHYAAMVNPNYTHMGVGVYVDIDDEGIWRCYAVTLFAAF